MIVGLGRQHRQVVTILGHCEKCASMSLMGGSNRDMRSLEEILSVPLPRRTRGFDHVSTKVILRIPPEDRTPALVDLLVRRNSPLVHAVAKELWNKYGHQAGCVIDYQDVVAAGMQGLLIGINRFDARYGNEFSTYSVNWIRQTALREIQNNSGIARIPIHFQERLHRAHTNAVRGRDAVADLVDHQLLHPVSLDAPLGEDIDLVDSIPTHCSVNRPRMECWESPENETLRKDLRSRIVKSFELMKSEKSRDILRMRFGINSNDESHTLEEVGKRYNLTRERVRQIAEKYFERVKTLKVFDEDELGVFRRVL